jgi:hypothetical protein
VKPVAFNDGGKGTAELREDGVIHLVWQPCARLDVNDIMAAMAKINELSEGAAHPVLVDMAGIATVSADARASFSTPSAAARIALLGSDPVDRAIANFRSANSYPCPTRYFTDQAEAVGWLLQDSPHVPDNTIQ